MQTTIQIKGMSCMHCVRAVESVLKAIPGVNVVHASIGEAVVEADDTVTEKTLKDAIRDEGYEVP